MGSWSSLSSVERYSLDGTQSMMNDMTTTRYRQGCSTIEKNNVTMVIVAGGRRGTIFDVFNCESWLHV